jgi:BirA family biotin operon repressor/biotin-[acetyl-CoA-carboxylase] ligase
LANQVPEWTIVLAESQTKGRGKPGFSWHSPPGGLYFSVILKPRKNPQDLTPITHITAVAVVGAIDNFNPQIKLPNDILIGKKKVCGILTERSGENLIIGIGLNVNTAEFPPELKATSLMIENQGKALDLKELLQKILANLKEEYLKYLGIKV